LSKKLRFFEELPYNLVYQNKFDFERNLLLTFLAPSLFASALFNLHRRLKNSFKKKASPTFFAPWLALRARSASLWRKNRRFIKKQSFLKQSAQKKLRFF
jgi:hypothetical protein